MRWQDYVKIDPHLHHGEPCIAGTRITVATILGSVADGMSMDDILAEYPQLTREAVQAALAYAAEALRNELLLPLSG